MDANADNEQLMRPYIDDAASLALTLDGCGWEVKNTFVSFQPHTPSTVFATVEWTPGRRESTVAYEVRLYADRWEYTLTGFGQRITENAQPGDIYHAFCAASALIEQREWESRFEQRLP